MTAPAVHHFRHGCMGSFAEIRIVGLDAGVARSAATAGFDEIDRLEQLLSAFRPGSCIDRINATPAGQAVIVSDEALDCLTVAREVFDATGGAFDVTVGPVEACWRTFDGRDLHPTDAQLADARERIGMGRLILDAETSTVAKTVDGMWIDPGGLGKGFVIDRVARLLGEWGIDCALLHAGRSSILAIGRPPGAPGWEVSIRHPAMPDATVGAISLADASLATSGTEAQGRHIIDPRTAQPAGARDLAWAYGPTAAWTDALATACIILSPDEIDALLRRLPSYATAIPANDPANTIRTFGNFPLEGEGTT